MNRVVKILMDRDGITKEEAIEQIRECKAEMMDCIECGDYSGAEDVLADYLGLEPDYIVDIF
jgi:hypothetical protein